MRKTYLDLLVLGRMVVRLLGTHLQLLDLSVGPVQLDLAEALVQAVHQAWFRYWVNTEGILKLWAVLALRVGVLAQLKVAVRHLLGNRWEESA